MADDELYSDEATGTVRKHSTAQAIADRGKMGRWIRSARIRENMPTDDVFADRIKDVAKLSITSTSLYNIQSGRKAISFEEAVATVATTRMRGGLHALLDAFDPELAERVRRLDDQWVAPDSEESDEE